MQQNPNFGCNFCILEVTSPGNFGLASENPEQKQKRADGACGHVNGRAGVCMIGQVGTRAGDRAAIEVVVVVETMPRGRIDAEAARHYERPSDLIPLCIQVNGSR